MSKRLLGLLFVFAVAGLTSSGARAENYALDPNHSSVTFKISHLGLSWIYGRFNDFSAECSYDPASPEKSTFNMTIKTESIDTNNQGRDKHLRSGDFFNAKQFPLITFKSTEVKAIDKGLKVTGDFTMHGETKSITFPLLGGKAIDFKGKMRTGFSTELKIKRSDFGMGKFVEMLGDDVHIAVSFEAEKK